jgi:hypothetical protein
MLGPPKDVDGECNARLFLSDDYGDNDCTIRCRLSPNHDGPHEENFKRGGEPVKITWVFDERKDENKEEFEEE